MPLREHQCCFFRAGFLPQLELSSMTINQSIELPLTSSDTCVLSGNLTTQNGNGSGTITGCYRRVLSHNGWAEVSWVSHYRQVSNIRRTKSQNLNVSCLVLQLSLHNLLKPGVYSRMKMKLEQRRQTMLQLHLSYQQFCSPLTRGLYWEIWRYLLIYSLGDITSAFSGICKHCCGTHPSISIFRLGYCPYPILWGWQNVVEIFPHLRWPIYPQQSANPISWDVLYNLMMPACCFRENFL